MRVGRAVVRLADTLNDDLRSVLVACSSVPYLWRQPSCPALAPNAVDLYDPSPYLFLSEPVAVEKTL